MLSSILPFPKTHLSSSISYSTHISKSPLLSTMITRHPSSTAIRMGGGPRTFPGGVSKWQWKRMQAKKAKQLLKARLCRERQIYEMRKRAELKAAVSELERPWEVVERSPNLFSIKADEQVKVLADRFHKVGGFDMWSENDGPVVFRNSADDGLPSARFFPKGVVHSVRPYGVEMEGEGEEVTGGGSRNKNLMRRRDNVSGLNPARPKGRLNPGSRLTGSKVENQNFDSEDVANEDNRRFRNGGRRRRAVVYRKPSTGTGGNSGKQSYGLRESEVIPTGRLNPGRGRLIGGKFQHLNSDSEDEANEDYQRISSMTMAYDSKLLSLPGIHWLGLLPSDLNTYPIPNRCLLPLTTKDKCKTNAMLRRCYLHHDEPNWRVELEIMLQNDVKFEIEALSVTSFTFLSNVYIPEKVGALKRDEDQNMHRKGKEIHKPTYFCD